MIGAFNLLVLCCLNWWAKVEIHEVEGLYYPDHLNLDQSDPDAWRIYAERVRDLMAKMLDMPKIDMGWRDWKVFDAIFIETQKKRAGSISESKDLLNHSDSQTKKTD